LVLQNPQTAKIVLDSINNDNEMPVLLFDWNNLGFTNDPTNTGRNGIEAQTKAEIVANLVTNRAVDYMNYGYVVANIPWYDIYLCDLNNRLRALLIVTAGDRYRTELEKFYAVMADG
jgi:hypothetical protein